MSWRISWVWAKRIVSLRGASPQRKRQIVWSVLVISVSMIPLVVSLILADGMISGITDRYVTFHSSHVQVQPMVRNLGPSPFLTDEVLEQIRSLPHVLHSSRVIKGLSLIYSRQMSVSVEITGVDASYAPLTTHGSMAIISGKALPEDNKDLVISSALAELLTVGIGDTVTLLSVQEREQGTFFKPLLMRVAGIVETGYKELDLQLAYTTLSTAGLLFHRASTYEELSAVSTLMVWMDSSEIDTVDEVSGSISGILDESAIAHRMFTWETMNPALFQNFASTRTILMIIMSIIIIIAGVNVSSSMTLLIQENRLHIGILKAMGTESRHIAAGLFMAVLFMTAVGTVLGLVCGSLIGLNLNLILSWVARMDIAASEMYLLSIPIKIDISELIGIAAFTMMVATISVVLPLQQIRRLQPIEILR